MNEKGEKVEYLYETTEGTLQLYGGFSVVDNEEYNETEKEIKVKNIIIYTMSGLLILSIVILIIVILKQRKEKVDETKNQNE